MEYPTMEQVERADIIQLCRWTRFLPSPGSDWIGDKPEPWFNGDSFTDKVREEAGIMDRILERQKVLGGWKPYISKLIGWEA